MQKISETNNLKAFSLFFSSSNSISKKKRSIQSNNVNMSDWDNFFLWSFCVLKYTCRKAEQQNQISQRLKNDYLTNAGHWSILLRVTSTWQSWYTPRNWYDENENAFKSRFAYTNHAQWHKCTQWSNENIFWNGIC